jgi:quercetin dioxygenase-like cupin family protein
MMDHTQFITKTLKQNLLCPLIAATLVIMMISTVFSGYAYAENSVPETKTAQREVVLENEQVQVVRLTYPAGTESGMHTHSFAHRVVYFVKGGSLSLVPQDTNKASKTLIATDGQTLFLPATTHNVRNIGNTEIVIVETELK